MKRTLHWYDFITINIYALGMSMSSGILTPLLLPYLIVLFMPPAEKTTHLATVRWVGLAVAMFIQPLAGMLSDRSTLRWGRRRPFIVFGALFNIFSLAMIAFSFNFKDADGLIFGVPPAFVVLMGGVILLQFSSNIAQGAFQGLIPDLVPESQHGRAAGFKAVMELLPIFLVIFIGKMVDKGYVWPVVAIIMAGFLVTMSVTAIFVQEKPLIEKPVGSIREPALRLVGLTAIFVVITQASVWMVKASGTFLGEHGASVGLQVALVGIAGLAAMAGSIFFGVYLGAWVGIGAEAPRHKGFIWWVINRLLFLVAVGSIQGFASYYLKDVVRAENPASMTTNLLAAVAVFLIPAALAGGYLADRLGRRRLLAWAGFIAAGGTLLLLLSGPIYPLIIVSGAAIGLGTGLFYTTNWAIGTDLVPPESAGKYLGVSNLAGAGAGIVGAGVGGPMADFFNLLSPGLGYIVIFSLYGLLFLLSVAALRQIK
jgi:MFS family permease